MNELFNQIFEEVISKQLDTMEIDRQLNERIEEYISKYNDVLSENEMERLRDCVYYAVLLSEQEAFYLGMKYTLKIMLFLLTNL